MEWAFEQTMAFQYEVPEDLLHLMGGFVLRREQDIVLLQSCLESDDFATVFQIAHRLQGNGSAYGFPQMSQIGKDLGQAARANDRVVSQTCVAALSEMVKEIKSHFG
jgi:HPt (histidine-containing phosphotransfer) domain-containing protein